MHRCTPQSRCRFGLSRADITPPVGIYHRMWGAATHERSTGIHRPLTATALVFQALDREPGPATEQIVVAVDHCLLWGRDMQTLLETVHQKLDLEPGQLLVAFSHTHSAGLMDRGRAHLPGGELIGPYLDRLAGILVDLIEQARTQVTPVTLVYGCQADAGLAGHRDFWDEQRGQYVCGYNPAGVIEDRLRVAAVHAEGRRLATLVNYACHPTTLAWENTLISPDFPGALREVVEQATGAPCVFLQGASGDIGPREGFVGDVAVADRHGRQLGYLVLSLLEGLPPPGTRYEYVGPVISGATLGLWQHRPLPAEEFNRLGRWQCQRFFVPLPYRRDLPNREQAASERERWRQIEQQARQAGDTLSARDAHAMIERLTRWLTRLEALPPGDHFPLPVTCWRMGDAIWVAVEGEHYQWLQRELDRTCQPNALMMLTLVNGSRCAYLPTRQTYGKGIYQESIAVLAPGCLETLCEELQRRLGEL